MKTQLVTAIYLQEVELQEKPAETKSRWSHDFLFTGLSGTQNHRITTTDSDPVTLWCNTD